MVKSVTGYRLPITDNRLTHFSQLLMKAMIFAAGLGTRFRPLTNSKPKALVEVNGTPLLEIVINRLKLFGFNEIIINAHHFAGSIIDFLNKKRNFNIKIIISDETEKLLGIGGGLKKASWFFNDNEPFLAHNVDIVSDIDLKQLYESHIRSEALVTLAVKNRQSSNYLLFDSNKTLCGWINKNSGEKKIVKNSNSNLTPLAFSGIHIISPSIFNLIKKDGVFPIIDTYLDLAANHKIVAFIDDNSLWIDAGKVENLKETGEILINIKNGK